MYLHINDRSKLDEHVSYCPATKKHQTRLESLTEDRWLPRSDVVLMNGTNTGREYTLHVGETHLVGDRVLLDILSREQILEVFAIAERMRENAKTHPVAKKLLVREWGDPVRDARDLDQERRIYINCDACHYPFDIPEDQSVCPKCGQERRR